MLQHVIFQKKMSEKMNDNNESIIKVLYLEDEVQNVKVKKFCEVAVENSVEIDIVKTKEDLIREVKDGSNEYPVVICDIEIWDAGRGDKNRILTCLGFDCIKDLVEQHHQLFRQYYLLSNCSKRLHDYIKQDFKKINVPIKSKDDVFTVSGTKKFIDEIKKAGNRVLDSLKDKGINNRVFDEIYQFIQKHYIEDFGTFDEIEEEITRRALALIHYFEDEGYKDSNKVYYKSVKDVNGRKKMDDVTYCNSALYFKNEKYSEITYISAATNQFVTSDYEKSKITISNDFLYLISAKLEKKHVENLKKSETHSDTTKEIVKKFITKLILRRLAIYIHKIYSQKTNSNKKTTRLTDVYPYFTPQDDAFLRYQLFMSGGVYYKSTVNEKQFFLKYFNTVV